jgi:predicted dehydrogenase
MVDPTTRCADVYDAHPELGIGVVGAGTIVENAHLPAYREAGFTVRGVTDLDEDRARAVADAFGIEAYGTLDAVLDDDAVDVVDVAVPPWEQRDVVERVVETGRHVLCQKPLADSLEDAAAIVEATEAAGVVAAVNQQLRWEGSIRAARQLVANGDLGTPLRARFAFDLETEWFAWLPDVERLTLLYFDIHALDAVRHLFGDPARVYATGGRRPGQAARGETRACTVLDYDGELYATVETDHDSATERRATYRFEGTDGVVRGSVELLEDAERGRPTTFEYRLGDDDWTTYELRNARYPDAFVGPMGTVLDCVANDGVPTTVPRDNLRTLRLVNAAYASMNDGNAHDPRDVAADHYPPGV